MIEWKENARRLTWRLVPSMGAIILLCTLIVPNLGSGPQWNLVLKNHADACQKNWWRNFLFIHNYFGFKNMCLCHTHHIGIDFQLFTVSPILVWSLWKWPRRSMVALLALAAISTGLRYYETLTRKLNLFINFGSSRAITEPAAGRAAGTTATDVTTCQNGGCSSSDQWRNDGSKAASQFFGR